MMQKVSNQSCIRRLSGRSLRANRVRNCVAVLAIALTTLLFTSLFTIAGTVVNSFQQATFRQVGGDMHGTFKDITWEQVQELSDDPLIVRTGSRLMLGMPSDPPFNKAHVEVSYMDESCARGSFCTPTVGSLPQEGTKQIACDTRILKLLGVEPEVGAQITMPYTLGGNTPNPVQREDVFTLSGWWEYDPAGMASQAIVPRSYVEEILDGYTRTHSNDVTGTWSLNVYLKSTAHIEEDLKTILQNHGYQDTDPVADNYIGTGVNWAYLGAQISETIDPAMVAAVLALLALIIFTGYLIIYNIFQISVTNDIRFYGLLKTIGTTPRQIRSIIRQQALTLSLFGIPLGLALGYGAGNLLAPAIMSTLSYTTTHTTANPFIFIGATAFSLVTVLISCRKPGRIAGRVSPVEAVRYTDSNGKVGKERKQGRSGGKLLPMALANLGRNRKKTVLVVLSLTLSVVLLQATYTFSIGFDMDKYLRSWVVTDFIVGNADYFQVTTGFRYDDQALPEEAISAIQAHGGVTEGGRIYGMTTAAQEFVTEDWYRQNNGRWMTPEEMDRTVAAQMQPDGLLPDHVKLFGMEELPLDQATLIDGDLAPLRDPNQNAIAAVYNTDDYGAVREDSHWAKVGDQVTVRYVDEWEYFDLETGEILDASHNGLDGVGYRAKIYRDATYTVTARVALRHSMTYRYFGADEFILGAEVFQRDTGTSDVMTYLFNTTDAANAGMEAFLKDYTEQIDPVLDYESKQSYVNEFESFRSMFLLLGGTLSAVIGVVGILNFLNAILTGIITRRREFAVLQSIGMTGKQLKTMLVLEGLLYALLASALSLALSLLLGPVMESSLGSMFWFFTYRFTLLPVACLSPVFLLLGALLPLLLYRAAARQSIVERLREAE